MEFNKLILEIRIKKEELYRMLEKSSDIQTIEIIDFSQELDQLIRNFYVLTGFCSQEKIKYKNVL